VARDVRRVPVRARPAGLSWPSEVRIGAGSLLEDDVRLGVGGGATRARGIEIGDGARIQGGSEIGDGVRIGDRLETGRNVSVGDDTVIGGDCRIASNTVVGADCVIGDRVRIGANSYIARFTTIQDDVTIAPGVCLANDPHPGSAEHACMRGPTIKRGAQLGMNVTVLPFVTIGERAVVGAGSVVTHDVPSALVVVGNPARVLKSVASVVCPLDLDAGEYQREAVDAPRSELEVDKDLARGRRGEGSAQDHD
jgi:acetyltransferase-like isoleucine patch superfamily enzyme